MGIWIELGVFVLAILWAMWQFHDLKQERLKREARQRALLAQERDVQRKAQPADTQVAAGMSAAPGAPADATGGGSAGRQAP